jgi:superfamily II DNA/RNA helicase
MKEETGNNEIKPKAETVDVGQTADEESVNVGAEVVESASEARQELKRLVEEQAREDERPLAGEFKLAKILGGEFLTAKIIRQQLWLILLVVGFTIIYISNRYSCDKQRIEIARLNKELEEAKFKAMSSTSDLTEVSRESNVLEMLRQNKDSVLHIPSQPPYIINVPEQ